MAKNTHVVNKNLRHNVTEIYEKGQHIGEDDANFKIFLEAGHLDPLDGAEAAPKKAAKQDPPPGGDGDSAGDKKPAAEKPAKAPKAPKEPKAPKADKKAGAQAPA